MMRRYTGARLVALIALAVGCGSVGTVARRRVDALDLDGCMFA